MKDKRLKKQGGYMLVEMLVSMVIFTAVAVSSAGALLSIIDANSKAQALKAVMDNLNVAIENMSRTIRIGTEYKCITSENDAGTYSEGICAPGTLGISFAPQDTSDPLTDRVKYFFEKANPSDNFGTLYRVDTDGNKIAITAPEVKINSLKFYVLSASTTPGQARVFININGQAGGTAFSQTPFNIQTSVSQREIETL